MGEWGPHALGQSCAHLEDAAPFSNWHKGALWTGHAGHKGALWTISCRTISFIIVILRALNEAGRPSKRESWHQEGFMEEGGSELGLAGSVAKMATTAPVWTTDFPQRDCGLLCAAAFPSTAVFFPSSIFWFLPLL